jgi:hypothetical protein
MKEIAMRRTLCLAAVLMSQVLIGAAANAATYEPGTYLGVVGARRADVYHMTFRAGDTTVIRVHGDGSTDLDLYVYDRFGNLIASDIRTGDDCAVWLTVFENGPFTIRVVNLGYESNLYTMSLD